MDLLSWSTEERKQINDFGLWWLSQRDDNPDDFPLDMTLVDWTEAYEDYGAYLLLQMR